MLHRLENFILQRECLSSVDLCSSFAIPQQLRILLEVEMSTVDSLLTSPSDNSRNNEPLLLEFETVVGYLPSVEFDSSMFLLEFRDYLRISGSSPSVRINDGVNIINDLVLLRLEEALEHSGLIANSRNSDLE